MNAGTKAVRINSDMTAQELWNVVAEFQISLDPPRSAGGRWLAGWNGEYAFGESPKEAVENLLREIGGVAE